MKLSKWVQQQGISYQTAWRWFKEGKLPVNSIQTASGTIIIDDSIKPNLNENIVIYCRVSNQSRKKELNYQITRCEDFCIANGWKITNIYKEVASGMNDNRKQFGKELILYDKLREAGGPVNRCADNIYYGLLFSKDLIHAFVESYVDYRKRISRWLTNDVFLPMMRQDLSIQSEEISIIWKDIDIDDLKSYLWAGSRGK